MQHYASWCSCISLQLRCNTCSMNCLLHSKTSQQTFKYIIYIKQTDQYNTDILFSLWNNLCFLIQNSESFISRSSQIVTVLEILDSALVGGLVLSRLCAALAVSTSWSLLCRADWLILLERPSSVRLLEARLPDFRLGGGVSIKLYS